MWQVFVFDTVAVLLFCGYLFRDVRRYERRADAFMAKMDADFAKRERKLDVEHAEFKASLRERTDRFIAEFLSSTPTADEKVIANTNGFYNAEAHDADSPRLDSSATL